MCRSIDSLCEPSNGTPELSGEPTHQLVCEPT